MHGSPMGQSLVLVCTPALRHPTRVVPADRPRVLGRSSRCDLVIDHASVSRRHATLEVCAGTIQVTDLGSSNGTFVDGVRVARGRVGRGPEMRFGGVTFIVSVDDEGVGDVDSSLDTGGTPAPDGPSTARWEVGLLSEAQRRVFDLVLMGMAEKGVAARLGISQHTVHNHLRAIYKALSVHSRAELMASVLTERREVGGRAASTHKEGPWTREPVGARGTGLKLYYLSDADRDAYRRLLDGNGIQFSESGGFLQIDGPVTPVVMRVLSAAVL
jgi:pSer/pThr/pTyr-binding forkhead associated (FHA) protein